MAIKQFKFQWTILVFVLGSGGLVQGETPFNNRKNTFLDPQEILPVEEPRLDTRISTGQEVIRAEVVADLEFRIDPHAEREVVSSLVGKDARVQGAVRAKAGPPCNLRPDRE